MLNPHNKARALVAALLFSCVVALIESSPSAAEGADGGIFIMGIDGMDPTILQRLMDEGKMPNFSKLAKEGSFQSLGTANPPQSPVAWSNFVTGMNPGGHGIFDFSIFQLFSYASLSNIAKKTLVSILMLILK